MAHKLPTETIVFAVSFLLIGAEFVLMGDSDEYDYAARPVYMEPAAGEQIVPVIEPGMAGPQPEFTEQEEVEEEIVEEVFEDEEFDMAFGQPIDNTQPLVSTRPEFDGPMTTDPEFEDTFDRNFGQPLPPEPMIDDFAN